MNVKKVQFVDEDMNDIKFETVVVPEGCKAPVPTVTVTAMCRFKMHALAKVVYREFKEKYGALEAYAFLLGSRMGFGEDIVIPEQEASGALVSVDPESVIAIKPEIAAKNAEREKANVDIRAKNVEIAKKNDEIRAENVERAKRGEPAVPEEKLLDELKPLQIIGWTHSHNTMSAFSSGTDDANHKRMHNDLILTDLKKEADTKSTALVPSLFYVIGITTNVRNEECAVVYASHPCGFKQQFTGANVEEVDEIDLTTEQMQSVILPILADIRLKVKTRRSSYSWTSSSRGSTPVTRTLDSYIRRRDTDIEDAVESAVDTTSDVELPTDIAKLLDEEASLEKIVTFKGVLDKIVAIQKACGGRDSKLYQEVKELLRGVVESERDFIIKKAGELSGKKKPNIDNFLVFDQKKGEVAKEPENTGTTIDTGAPAAPIATSTITSKCSACGKVIDDDGDVQDRDSGKTGVDGSPICNVCAAPPSLESYYDDDGTPTTCSGCKSHFTESDPFAGDEDEKGLPLCVKCASLLESIEESKTIPDQEVKPVEAKQQSKDPAPLKPGAP
jgi:proteasome lid subunit RPN8/RPN11